MSVAVSVKVSDGFAIAADSATTLATRDGQVANIYNSANKIVNLYKGLPIGLMFWDSGSIGNLSLATIAKDLRKELKHETGEFFIDRQNYTIEQVAQRVADFFFQKYQDSYRDMEEGTYPSIGFYVCGFGSNDDFGQSYTIIINNDGELVGPTPQGNNQPGDFVAYASPDPIHRLVVGFSAHAQAMVRDEFGLDIDEAHDFFMRVAEESNAGFVEPAMPIMDALELVEFLVQMTAMYYRFAPGNNTVGGPVEVAAITKHEGFKWVNRKLYFDSRMNS